MYRNTKWPQYTAQLLRERHKAARRHPKRIIIYRRAQGYVTASVWAIPAGVSKIMRHVIVGKENVLYFPQECVPYQPPES